MFANDAEHSVELGETFSTLEEALSCAEGFCWELEQHGHDDVHVETLWEMFDDIDINGDGTVEMLVADWVTIELESERIVTVAYYNYNSCRVMIAC